MKSATLFCLMALEAVTLAGASGDVPLDKLTRYQGSCNPDQVQVCAAPVQDFLSQFNVPVLERLTEISNLDHLCNQLHDTERCLTNIQPDCSILDNIQYIFQMYRDVVGYICSAEGRDVLLTGRNCFEDLEKKNALQPCFEKFEHLINDQDPCGVMDQLSICVEDKVRNVCSNKEGDFAATIMSRYLEPVKGATGCDVGNKARRARNFLTLFNL